MAKITQEKKVPFETALSMTGYGLFNVLLLLVSGGCLMCVIIETMGMMFIIPAAHCDLDLGLSEKGLLSSVSFVGVVISSFIWGYLADVKGRKNVLVISLATSGISTILCSIVPWAWLFILLRLINGLFIGGASCVIYAYTGEFHDMRYRPKAISWMSTFVAMGNMYLPGFAWLILPQDWEINISALSLVFKPWRLLLIIYTFPCLICAIALYYFPESPKFLLTQQRHDEALSVLKKMYVINNRKAQKMYNVEEIIFEELEDDNLLNKEHGMFKTMWIQTAPLFKKNLLIKTLMMCFLQFGVFASNAGIFMWYPEILNRMSHYVEDTGKNDVSLCSAISYGEPAASENLTTGEISFNECNDSVNSQVFLVSLIMGVAYAAMYVFIGCVINIIGKKQLMIAFVSVTTIAGLTSQFVFGYALIQILIGIFIMGGSGIGITNAIAVDLFPTQVRGKALAVSLMFGRIGAMTGTSVVGPLVYNLCDYLFYFVAVDHILLIIVVLLIPTSQSLLKSVAT